MKKILLILFLLIVGCYLLDDNAKSTVFLTQDGTKVGNIVFKDTAQGLMVRVHLKNLPKGEHGFHIHENPSCEAAADEKGVMQPALKAGGHYDPDKTKQHLGPEGSGHKGDLPLLMVSENGDVQIEFYTPRLTVKEVRDRSIVVHENGDNYEDTPMPLGGGGKRIACGVIK